MRNLCLFNRIRQAVRTSRANPPSANTTAVLAPRSGRGKAPRKRISECEKLRPNMIRSLIHKTTRDRIIVGSSLTHHSGEGRRLCEALHRVPACSEHARASAATTSACPLLLHRGSSRVIRLSGGMGGMGGISTISTPSLLFLLCPSPLLPHW